MFDLKPSGIVFDIQRYSIHDGPGIRTTVFLKGCPLSCSWCQNPESQSKEPEMLFNISMCSGCGRCVEICPKNANIRAEAIVQLDRGVCVLCGECVDLCPNEARKIAGKEMTVEEVVREVLKDRMFYKTSGGGVTLSGGEATFQPGFAAAILKECKVQGLHTTLETCGYTSWPVLEQVVKYTDLVLFDIKHMDPVIHKEGTGMDNDIILENAKKVAQLKPMRIRVPLIPGFNDSDEVVKEIAAFAASLPNQIDVDLLTYNPLGEGKYERLGKEGVDHKEVQSDEYVEALRDTVNRELKKRRLKIVR